MKELSKERVLKIFLVFILFVSISFVQAAIETRNSKGLTTSNFLASDEIFLKSSTGLCNNVYETVDIYVIKSGTTLLTDIRGSFQEINLTSSYQIPANTKIWQESEPGIYDVIIDCNKDGDYHPLEPKASFNVSFKKGSGIVFLGNEIKNNSWQYDAEDEVLRIEMLQLNVSAKGEDIDLVNIKIKSAGKGDDSQMQALEIYADANDNGKLDENEELIGDSQPAYAVDNGETSITLDYTLAANSNAKLLIVYLMKEDVGEGDFSLSVTGLSGTGQISKQEIKFLGTSINSNTLIVIPKKTCLGGLVLELIPNPVEEGEKVFAKASNLTGCDNKTVFLRTTPCTDLSGDIGSCVLKNNSCGLSLSSPENKIYYSCIDKNNDTDALDFGETSNTNLAVTPKVEEESEASSLEESNETSRIAEENATVTGNVVSGLFDSSLKGIFVILEITLLLILIVLIIISIRLKGSRQEKIKVEKKKAEKEE